MTVNDFLNDVFAASGWKTDFQRQIDDNCVDAGLSIMSEILAVIHDRDYEGHLNEVMLKVSSSEEIHDLYTTIIGPALDRLEQALYDMTEED